MDIDQWGVGGHNQATVTQGGTNNGNDSDIDQWGPGGYNTATVTQRGANNTNKSNIKQYGGNNSATVFQGTDGSTDTSGGAHDSYVSQDGNDNTARVKQFRGQIRDTGKWYSRRYLHVGSDEFVSGIQQNTYQSILEWAK